MTLPTTRTRPARTRALAAFAGLTLLLALLSGCSPYRFVGNQVMLFAEKAGVPTVLANDDADMACKAAHAFAAAALSFEAVGSDVDPMAVLILTANGICAEARAYEAERDYLRALSQARIHEGADARIRQKRLHELAARRQYLAWQRLVAIHGDLREGQCPRFRSDYDELVFLVGIIAGLQSVLNDAQVLQAVGVPRDIAPLAAHMTACLDSAKWWELPLSIRAAFWSILPSSGPEGADPMALLEENAHRGAERGVRLAHVVWALVAYGRGDAALTRRAVRDFVASPPAPAGHPHRMLDRIAENVILGLSDRIWTEATGTRTPTGGLGSFPDDPPRVPVPDIGDLLAP